MNNIPEVYVALPGLSMLNKGDVFSNSYIKLSENSKEVLNPHMINLLKKAIKVEPVFVYPDVLLTKEHDIKYDRALIQPFMNLSVSLFEQFHLVIYPNKNHILGLNNNKNHYVLHKNYSSLGMTYITNCKEMEHPVKYYLAEKLISAITSNDFSYFKAVN